MSPLSWLLFAACAVGALALVRFVYRRREMPGKGRGLLAALRCLAVLLLILLVFDPDLPTPGLTVGARGTQVIADASLSMTLPAAPGGESRWDRVRAEATRSAGMRDVLLFGENVRAVPAESLSVASPDAPSSRLLPALQAASEAGLRRVIVLTDGAIDDAPEVSVWLPRLGMDVEYRTIADALPNAALAEIEAPSWAEAGKPVEIRFGVAGVGVQGDTADVSVSTGGQVLAAETVVVPEPGRVAGGILRFTPAVPPGGGLVRYDVRLDTRDAAPDDNVRAAYIFVSDEPAGVALVSFRPDWEPRFLLPVLEQALGLPVRGYLRTRDGTYVRSGEALEAGQRANEEEVRRVLGRADLVVVHGLDNASPAWASELLSTARRYIVLPSGEAAGVQLPVQIGRPVSGDWYLAPEIPSSPVASGLAGLDVDDVPPLSALNLVQAPAGAWVALAASRGRRGPASPVAIAGESAGKRWAVGLGEGYWRWAFRGASAKQAYSRLWGSIAGWILQEHGTLAAATVRPVDRVVPRGSPVRWVAPGLAPDSLRVRLAGAAEGTQRDTVLTARGDTAVMPPMPPGQYRYDVSVFTPDGATATADGEFTVESYSPEFTRPTVTMQMLEAGAVPVGPDARGRSGRPLHASAWPYIAIVLLIAVEWVFRRRWGLR
ncbi:MAG: hypothetical protein ACREMQ_04875 [Longimicrobiales bacterium]